MGQVGADKQRGRPGSPWGERAQLTRSVLFVYAGFAMLTAVVFWLNPESDFFQPFGAAFYALASITSLTLGLLLDRDPVVRQAAIGLQMLSVPVQLATSTESHLPLLVTIASIASLFLLKPEFPRLSPSLRKLFLTLHVGFAASWLGAALAMLMLSVVALVTGDLALRHNAYLFMHLFDLVLWIPLILLALVSGLVVSLGTEWGLLQYRWVMTKIALVVGLLGAHFVLIQLTDFLENFWVRELAEATAVSPGADLGFVPQQTAITMVLFVATLWIATALSIYKPWGAVRWTWLPSNDPQPTAQRSREGVMQPMDAPAGDGASA
jgi:hypothetical protein